MERAGALRGKRYRLIDTLRALALLNMLVFHFLYDVFVVYGGDFSWTLHPAVVAWERYICVSFLLIAGVSLHFSRHVLRRGLIVNACGLLITLVTAVAIPGQIVIFGILNCIGCSMLLIGALRRWLVKLDPFAGAGVSLLLYAVLYGLPYRYLGFFGVPLLQLPEALYQFPPLCVLGLPAEGFFSSDYFPLLPWSMLIFCGFFLWQGVLRMGADRFFLRGVPVLDQIGKYTLWIYLAHQPVLMGLCFLLFGGA